MRLRPLLCSLLVSLALAGPAVAAPPAAAAPPGPRADLTAMRAEVRARLRAHRTARLIEALHLDEAGAARVVPVLQRFDAQLDPVLVELGTARRELKVALKAPTPEPAAVTRLVDRMLAGRERLERVSRDRLAALRGTLSPVQFGRAVLVLAAIDRKVDKQLQKAMRQATRGRRSGRGTCDPSDPFCAGKPGKAGKHQGRPIDPFGGPPF